MHMADALISPTVGGTMLAATAGLIAYSAKKTGEDLDEGKVPLMGVLGAFIFAAQMINFSIPATGSSGHLGGGMILAILLGPYAAFLTMASILTVQALFFADGGLLALGCNIFNLGFFSCFVAYPLIYQRVVGGRPTRGRILFGAVLGAVVALQLGAFGVVLETLFSGITALPFSSFVLLMQPIHLAIGIVEGLVTGAVVLFVWKARPEALAAASPVPARGGLALKRVVLGLAVAAVVIGGGLSWFASTHPDGLEWAMFHTSGQEELAAPAEGLHGLSAAIQEKTALLPDYQFKGKETAAAGKAEVAGHGASAGEPAVKKGKWPAVSKGTSVAGLLGGAMTLLLAGLIGLGLRAITRAK
jgi:cobalt/nickel transport system permease protein